LPARSRLDKLDRAVKTDWRQTEWAQACIALPARRAAPLGILLLWMQAACASLPGVVGVDVWGCTALSSAE
jgi:hypothetical protein